MIGAFWVLSASCGEQITGKQVYQFLLEFDIAERLFRHGDSKRQDGMCRSQKNEVNMIQNTSARCSCPQRQKASSTGSSVLPRGERLYSTLGGISP